MQLWYEDFDEIEQHAYLDALFCVALWAISCLLSYVSHHNGINVLQTKNSHALLARLICFINILLPIS